jgi:hypothetical protein
MMSQNVENSHGYFLKNPKILLLGDYSCCVCSQGKLITKQFPSNIVAESPSFLERIQNDICEPIHDFNSCINKIVTCLPTFY